MTKTHSRFDANIFAVEEGYVGDVNRHFLLRGSQIRIEGGHHDWGKFEHHQLFMTNQTLIPIFLSLSISKHKRQIKLLKKNNLAFAYVELPLPQM